MKIKLSPVRVDCEPLITSVNEDVITVNGCAFDFSRLKEGETLPHAALPSDMFAGDVERVNGKVCLTLILPHGPNAPQETRFPEYFDVYMTVTDGPVPLPPYDAPRIQEEDVDE